MEEIYAKIKDMLKAYYPVLYLTSYEYDRTKQKIEGIINVLKSEGKVVRLFNWNCVDGLKDISNDKPISILNKDGEEIADMDSILSLFSGVDISTPAPVETPDTSADVSSYIDKLSELQKKADRREQLLPTKHEIYVSDSEADEWGE